MKKYKNLDCILLIDDDEATNFINKMVIKKADFDVNIEVCENGKHGLDYLTCQGRYSSEKEFPQPGIIFLDINMPGMNGWEFMEKYKNLPDNQKARIVIAMLTTSLNPDDEFKGENNEEIRSFMNKPLTIEMLMDIVNVNFNEI